MEDKPLAEDISLFIELEKGLLENRSSDLKRICPDPEHNRRLSKFRKKNEYPEWANWLASSFFCFMQILEAWFQFYNDKVIAKLHSCNIVFFSFLKCGI